MQAREILIGIYLDWFNNYVSVETFADHGELTYEDAYDLIELARRVFNANHPES